ncbi:unnamed protein product [Pieris brassicae]|uniref:Uncharacterized protein n=1 Tax=Pieris brassicae TaxID=7116 RepID=A0A9P0TKY6_PIEBR|nr:unnamed protein product [Pieris brassicae]
MEGGSRAGGKKRRQATAACSGAKYIRFIDRGFKSPPVAIYNKFQARNMFAICQWGDDRFALCSGCDASFKNPILNTCCGM